MEANTRPVAPAGPPPRPGPGPTRRKTGQGSSVLGWVVLSGVISFAFGSACTTCVTGLGHQPVFAGAGNARVGVIEVIGPIMDASTVVRNIRHFAGDSGLDALVVRIDSPGGAVGPSQEIYEAMRYASTKKPVVASMGGVAASGGLWAAMGADRVFASPGSIVGSIGVITQAPDLQKIAEKLSFSMRVFRSGPLKDQNNPFRPITAAEESAFMELIADVYDQFIRVVAERRALTLDEVRTIADGRVMTGRAALDLGLVDELGGLYEAARASAWLAEVRSAKDEGQEPPERNVEEEEDPTLVYPRPEGPEFLKLLTAEVAAAAGRGLVEGVGDGAEREVRDRARMEVEAR